jgi:ribosomal protein S27E
MRTYTLKCNHCGKEQVFGACEPCDWYSVYGPSRTDDAIFDDSDIDICPECAKVIFKPTNE